MQNRRLLSALHVFFWLFFYLNLLTFFSYFNSAAWLEWSMLGYVAFAARLKREAGREKKENEASAKSKAEEDFEASLQICGNFPFWKIDLLMFSFSVLMKAKICCVWATNVGCRFGSGSSRPTADRRWNISLPAHLLRRLNLACFQTNSVLHCRPICARPADERRSKIVSFIF